MKKVEQVIDALEQDAEAVATVQRIAAQVTERFRDELGISGGRLWERDGEEYVLVATFPDARDVRGMRVAMTYGPVATLLRHRAIYVPANDGLIDPELEARLGVSHFAAIVVGDQRQYLLSFDVDEEHDPAAILYSLGILRHGINQKLRRQQVADLMDQAKQIQLSILPRTKPAFGDFELAGRSKPVDLVGGDFYDFIPISDKILGVAIADSSGHGLPAALQVRDVHMGLRMGLSRDYKIVRTIERLNAIIHESTLTSRFVSLFYGELEQNGAFTYTNAGHPPPFHCSAVGGVAQLDRGGPVLGPLSEASYERGFVKLEPGDRLVLFTDGIVEMRDASGVEYGRDRLQQLICSLPDGSAAELVEAIFADVERFAGGERADDDRTVVAVRRPAT